MQFYGGFKGFFCLVNDKISYNAHLLPTAVATTCDISLLLTAIIALFWRRVEALLNVAKE